MPRSIWVTDSAGNLDKSRRSVFGRALLLVLADSRFLTVFGFRISTRRFLLGAFWLTALFFGFALCFTTLFPLSTLPSHTPIARNS
jgi:hypothetical protein